MVALDRGPRARFDVQPRSLHVVEGITAAQDLPQAEKKHMACLPGLATNKLLMNRLAREVSRARPDYEAEAVDVYNAGRFGAKNRLKKEKDVIKREADQRQESGSVAGYSWGSLDALQIASELPEEVDEVVLMFSPHKMRRILSGNMAKPTGDHVINVYGVLDPVTLVGGKYDQADQNVQVVNTHFGAIDPAEIKPLVRSFAPQLRGLKQSSSPEAA